MIRKAKGFRIVGIIALAAIVALAGCGDPGSPFGGGSSPGGPGGPGGGGASGDNQAPGGGGTGGNNQTAPAAINIAAIPGVTPPVAGATPVAAIPQTAQFTGTVTWSPAVSGTFAGNTAYTATITLAARPGFTLQGVAANFFTVAGATTAANPANSGAVAATFPPATLGHSGTPGLTFSAPSGSPLTVTVTGADAGASGAIVIPASFNGYPVTAIGNSAFAGRSLTGVTIPDSVTSIGDNAFLVNNLDSVTIPAGVTSIGDNAFNNNNLGSVTIPAGVTSIGIGAFADNNLGSVSIPASVTSIADNAFRGNQLVSVTIPGSVTSIGGGAFQNNQLTSVTIPGSVTSIENNAFRDNSLTSITIGNGSMTIGNADFVPMGDHTAAFLAEWDALAPASRVGTWTFAGGVWTVAP